MLLIDLNRQWYLNVPTEYLINERPITNVKSVQTLMFILTMFMRLHVYFFFFLVTFIHTKYIIHTTPHLVLYR